MIFYIALVVFAIISLIELNPNRFKKASPYKKTDKFSGGFITLASAFVGLLSIVDKIFNLFPINTGANDLVIIFGLVLFISGFFIRYLAIKELGTNFNYAIAPIRELKTKGIYKKIRHPSYLGTILYSVGVPFMFLSKLGFFATLIVIISILYRIKLEELFLERTVGNSYLNYKNKTYKLIPHVY